MDQNINFIFSKTSTFLILKTVDKVYKIYFYSSLKKINSININQSPLNEFANPNIFLHKNLLII